MKTNNLFFLALVLSFLSIPLANAQSYETISKWNKTNSPAVAIDVNAPVDIATQSLYDLLKSEQLKGKKSGKTVSFEKVIFPTISKDYINLYGSVVEKDNNNSTVYIFINGGAQSDFVTSTADPRLIENLENYLNVKYAPTAAKANLDAKIDAQNKLIKDSSKNLDKIQDDLQKKIQQKEKLISDIENLTKQIEQQKTLLEQQKADLTKISVPQ